MKTIQHQFHFLCLVLSLFISGQLYAQEYGDIYRLRTDVQLKQCDLAGRAMISGQNKADTIEQALVSGWKFKIIHRVGDNYIIHVLAFKADAKEKDNSGGKENLRVKLLTKGREYNESYVRSDEKTVIYYLLDADILEKVAYKHLLRFDFTGGAVTTPIKFRFGRKDSISLANNKMAKRDFDFATNVNIGLSVGLKYRFGPENKNSINLLAGAAIDHLDIDSSTTNGAFKAGTADIFGVTLHGSIIVEIADKFQFVSSIGWDYMGRDIGKSWNYQGAPWFGLGIGVNIFDTGKVGAQPVKQYLSATK